MILQKSILTRQGEDFKGTAAATGGLGVGMLCGCSGHEGGGYGFMTETLKKNKKNKHMLIH